MHPVISVSGLSKRYGSLMAVADIEFEVFEHEIFGLLGPNGAGKTTTVECLQGLRHPDAGHMKVLGRDPRTEADWLRLEVGSQLQESSLPSRLKVWEALDLFSSLLPGGPDWRDVMEQWGLSDKASASFGSLSGGQRQRLLVALALVNDPRVVFLDEMTTGLDPAARRSTWELIKRIRDAGTTVVLVTHFMDEAEHLCDRLAVVKQGSIVASGTPSQLIGAYQQTVVVRFSAENSDTSFLGGLPGVTSFDVRGPTVEVTGTSSIVPLIGKALVDRGIVPSDMGVIRPSLEDVYLHLVEESNP